MAEQDAVRTEKTRAKELLRTGRLSEALAVCQRVLRQAPDDVDTCHRTAGILARQGRSLEALELYRKAATLFRQMQQSAKALAVYKLMLLLDPTDEEALAAAKSTERRPLFFSAPEVTKPPPRSVTGSMLSRLPPVLGALEAAERAALANALEVRTCRKGETLLAAGSRLQGISFLIEGTARVERDEAPADGLELEGHASIPPMNRLVELRQSPVVLGALALFVETPSDENVIAATDTTELFLPSSRFDELAQTYPHLRELVSWAAKDTLLGDLIQRSSLLAPLAEVNRSTLLAQAQVRAFPPGVALLREGAPAAGLYALLQGRCRAHHQRPEGIEEFPGFLPGEAFGELSLLTGAPATATVETSTPCIVLGLSRASVLAVAEAHPRVQAHFMEHGVEREAYALEWARRAGGLELM